jgi:hypothetical protein
LGIRIHLNQYFYLSLTKNVITVSTTSPFFKSSLYQLLPFPKKFLLQGLRLQSAEETAEVTTTAINKVAGKGLQECFQEKFVTAKGNCAEDDSHQVSSDGQTIK